MSFDVDSLWTLPIDYHGTPLEIWITIDNIIDKIQHMPVMEQHTSMAQKEHDSTLPIFICDKNNVCIL